MFLCSGWHLNCGGATITANTVCDCRIIIYPLLFVVLNSVGQI